ncbi:TPM domain-containing protein [Meridianimaribacter sp. CL38]|uniref:TPM domain-containing protein n=1 Tax=Meridianimaribacter sp. CL38 TaxID=2213021 RepID=UPI00103C1C3B|nr:TPM domain-containing protein [Meridianimaribacter sp. CL38]TBV27696.1 TPM domain-containing protein [Meridianimaribacter sp. CL38]
MSTVENFLSQTEEQEVIKAIRDAERLTSGEIRVHLEKNDNGNAEARAMEVFHYLKMDNTKLQNGVLIYVAIEDKSFAIYGDKGINNVVANDFWESTKNTIQSHFKSGRYKDGLIYGILTAGEQLQHHFPWNHFDTDELPNEISKI